MSIEAEPKAVRYCARVVIADEHDQVLLLHSSGYVTPESQFFCTVGGMIDEGETSSVAAARELFEETGLRVAPEALGPVVARTAGSTDWLGPQEHDFYFLRTERFEVRFDHLDADEAKDLTGSAWLSLDQLAAADHAVFPVPIAHLVKRLLSGETPPEPVELPWVPFYGADKRCPIPG